MNDRFLPRVWAFNLSTDPADYKAPNKKGVRHHKECFNDEVGVTICICEPIRPETPQ